MGQQIFLNAFMLIAQNNGRGPQKIPFPQGFGRIRKRGGEDLELVLSQFRKHFARILVPDCIHPFPGRCRAFAPKYGKGCSGIVQMNVLDAESIA